MSGDYKIALEDRKHNGENRKLIFGERNKT